MLREYVEDSVARAGRHMNECLNSRSFAVRQIDSVAEAGISLFSLFSQLFLSRTTRLIEPIRTRRFSWRICMAHQHRLKMPRVALKPWQGYGERHFISPS